MKWNLVWLFFGIGFFANCQKPEPIVNACDQTLWEMVEISDSLWKLKLNGDETSLKQHLSSFRYELQGLSYSIEIVKVGEHDSLYWVGAMHLASCYYDNSLDDELWFNQNSENHSMFKKDEAEAIIFYIKNAAKLSDRQKQAWLDRVKRLKPQS